MIEDPDQILWSIRGRRLKVFNNLNVKICGDHDCNVQSVTDEM